MTQFPPSQAFALAVSAEQPRLVIETILEDRSHNDCGPREAHSHRVQICSSLCKRPSHANNVGIEPKTAKREDQIPRDRAGPGPLKNGMREIGTIRVKDDVVFSESRPRSRDSHACWPWHWLLATPQAIQLATACHRMPSEAHQNYHALGQVHKCVTLRQGS